HGVNMYDYSARYKDEWRFTTVDPLAEKYYSWSPHVYVGNNPMKRTDPTGMDWWSTNNQDEIERILATLKAGEKVDTESFGNDWTRVTDQELSENLDALDGGQGVFDDVSLDFTIDGTSWKDFQGYGIKDMKNSYTFGTRNNPFFKDEISPNLLWPSMILVGQPLRFLKNVGALGSARGSSIISYTLSEMSKTLPIKMGTRGSSMAYMLTGAHTTNFGRFAGRFVPVIGWGATAIDIQYTFVGIPNMEQIKENITRGRPAQEGVYNPTTGQYQVTNAWGFTW
ncbi:MAG: hypothetical protein E6767_20745, partial [Dysgonomonas sp.]|nr:hypothetical protein [Dysgonomonas sp.]